MGPLASSWRIDQDEKFIYVTFLEEKKSFLLRLMKMIFSRVNATLEAAVLVGRSVCPSRNFF